MAQEFKIQGKIHKVLEFKSGVGASSGKEWAKQTFVMEKLSASAQHADYIVFDVWGKEKLDMFALKEGDNVLAYLDINAREYNGRWYNDIKAYRVDKIQIEQAPAPAPQPQPQPQSPVNPNWEKYTPPTTPQSNPDNDLPF